MIPKRIRHKGICDHAQTPYARRKCRAAKTAAIQTTPPAPTYKPGDIVDLGGTDIILGARTGNTGVRWSWYAPDFDVDGLAYLPTPEEAIENARRRLNIRCRCGNVAEMTASTGPACVRCYDQAAA